MTCYLLDHSTSHGTTQLGVITLLFFQKGIIYLFCYSIEDCRAEHSKRKKTTTYSVSMARNYYKSITVSIHPKLKMNTQTAETRKYYILCQTV